MIYNTQRPRMAMPEYGRSIHEMVQTAIHIEDRDTRNLCANTIIDIMANMLSADSEQPDFYKKLWDHLAYMSDYNLDVDYPFEITRLDAESKRPEPLPYPMQSIRHRHYGHLLEEAIRSLGDMPDGEERSQLLVLVANQMKQSLYDWNVDAMDDEKIAQDIARYTQGRLQPTIEEMQLQPIQHQQMPSRNLAGKGKKRKRN